MPRPLTYDSKILIRLPRRVHDTLRRRVGAHNMSAFTRDAIRNRLEARGWCADCGEAMRRGKCTRAGCERARWQR